MRRIASGVVTLTSVIGLTSGAVAGNRGLPPIVHIQPRETDMLIMAMPNVPQEISSRNRGNVIMRDLTL